MDFIEFRNYALECSEKESFLNAYAGDMRGKLLAVFSEGRFFTPEGEKLSIASCVSDPDPLFTGKLENLFWLFRIKFKTPAGKVFSVRLESIIYDDRIELKVTRGSVKFKCILKQGREKRENLLAMKSCSTSCILQGASGPAVPQGADLLYNRRTDGALKFSGNFEIKYDWKKKRYCLEAGISGRSPLTFRFEKNYAKDLLHLKYWKGISHGHGFRTPPVGWMTWYAVRFDASEKIVLENAAAMKELFGKFNGKIVIWVDWEWCHKKMYCHSEKGVDVLHCRKEAYPHGMKSVSDKLKKMGVIPALWTGVTCDGNMNEYFRKNPDYCLADVLNWAGRYWADLSHPGVQNEYIPAVFKTLLSWGYEMFKWDCLLNTMRFNDQFRSRRHDPEMTTNEAMHRVIAAGRKTVGENFYLLGCTGMERATMAAIDLFDACRIGGDVFTWEDFKNNAVIPIFSYFPLHNTAIFLDPDTLVLRKEYSTFEQALSRISLFALTGMQLTLGDPVSELDNRRIDALKRAMPVPEITPQEMCRKDFSGEIACVMITAARPWGNWYTAGVFNMTGEKRKYRLAFDTLPQGPYAAFEFWSKKFYGVSSDGFDVELPPGGCAVFRLTPVSEGVPCLTGSSRHLLQGVIELREYAFDAETNTISGALEVVEGDDAELFFYAPEGFAFEKQEGLRIRKECAVLEIPGTSSGVIKFQINCKEKK